MIASKHGNIWCWIISLFSFIIILSY